MTIYIRSLCTSAMLIALGWGLCFLPAACDAQEGSASGSFGAAEGKAKASARAGAKGRPAAGGNRSTGPAQPGKKPTGKAKPADPAESHTDLPTEPAVKAGGAAEKGSLEGNIAVSRNLVNGRRILQVSTDNKTVTITEKSSGAVSLLVTTYEADDTESIKHYTAASVEELATKHPEAALLYQQCKVAAKPKPEESLLGGITGDEVDIDAAMKKAKKELGKLRGSEELDDGGRALLDQVLKGLGE